ncbi:MAG TPA: radical SAM protein, partial [Smithellaceae bacterium]|nr:radical SAM protein [Smithellaceae bacterium]
PYSAEISLADYQTAELNPVRSTDLLQSAAAPEKNPFYRYFQERLTAALAETPAYCGFSVNYLSQAICAFAMIGFVKKQNPRQKIILGGSLITSWLKTGRRRDIFSGLVDDMVEGPGEEFLLALLGKTDGGNKAALNYDDFAYDEYLTPGRIIPYSAASGCYWHGCSFCPETAEGNQYRAEPATAAVAELQRLNKEINPVLIHILDSALSPALLLALAKQPPGAPWYGFARVTPQLTDPDFCLALRKSGCVMLKLGIESGDQNVLDALRKGIKLSDAAAALRTLKQSGIAAYVYLLLGTPPEDEASAFMTRDFILKHAGYIDFLNLAIFNLPILSAEAPALATRSFYKGDLSLYSGFRHPLGWERSKVRAFLEKTLKKNPTVAAILQRTPPCFTSNHAPFFVLNKAIEI